MENETNLLYYSKLCDFVLFQVSTHCHRLPKYVAIAQFHNGRVTSKTGVFIVCTQSDGFEVDNVNTFIIYKENNVRWTVIFFESDFISGPIRREKCVIRH